MVRFLLDGEVVTLTEVDPTGSVLDLIRYKLRRTGTKEGCAEGDCGACTVLIGELEETGEAMTWRAVNACILFIPALDGRALMTVESVSPKDGPLHPVQSEMVARHGSQCGFCTPGIVMSLVGRSMGAVGMAGTPSQDVLAGNLCRCTGYGPILDAAEAVPAGSIPRDDAATVAALKALRRKESLSFTVQDPLAGVERRWFAPRTVDELAALRLAHPEAHLLAGGTDVGLWVTKQHRVLAEVIWLGEVAELRRVKETEAGLTLGAGVRYAEAHAALGRLHPDLGELVRRIGGLQVRSAGTIGGNIANGSPIGDLPPALIALGAALTLRVGVDRRTIPLEDFFIAYGQQDLRSGEFVEGVFIPRPRPGDMIRITKLSKRFDSDISGVCAAFALRLDDEHVLRARLAFGGMAGTPRRALAAEAALEAQPLGKATIEAACSALAEDFQPLSDLRGSSAYRLRVAANLLRRLWVEAADPGEPVSVLEPVDG